MGEPGLSGCVRVGGSRLYEQTWDQRRHRSWELERWCVSEKRGEGGRRPSV